MADIEEIIDYIKSLKKGFDKDLFQNKIDELTYAVDNTGLSYDDFHTLFKVWLNLSIPITKWISVGCCLVPPDIVEERTVEYAFRWLLTNYQNQTSFSRIGFLLDWLTAAMNCESIDMVALDVGYEIFYTMLKYDVLSAHVLKLVYTLTKPGDVTRQRVLELHDCAKKRENKKNLYNQLQVLLALFKSYKPECVPEDVPAISVHTLFKRINVALLNRFRRNQVHRNNQSKESYHLFWTNLISSENGRNKKVEPLVPNLQYVNIGSKQYADKESQKNYLDFTDAVSLLQYSARWRAARPARLRALLCNPTGLTLLAIASDTDLAFLSHDLHHLLTSCFLDSSSHSYAEKRDLLHKLAILQRTLTQGIPVITRFLAQYLPSWNEKDYFPEIIELIEWISVDCPEHVSHIIKLLTRIYCRAQPMEQCAITRCLSNMYVNLVFVSTKKHLYFTGETPSQTDYSQILLNIASSISDLYNKGLQVAPEDLRVVYSGMRATERMALAVASPQGAGAALWALPPPSPLALALALLAGSAALLDKLAAIMMLYKRIFMSMKSMNKNGRHEMYMEHLKMLKCYTSDIFRCWYTEDAISGRQTGLVFHKLRPQFVKELAKFFDGADAMFSIRNSLAFAPYTYLQLVGIDHANADNKLWFDIVIDQEFTNISKFLKKAFPELR